MPDVHIVVLAAGKGTRMKSARAKVLHETAGRPLIEHVLAAADRLAPRSLAVVIGHQGDAVRGALAGTHPHLDFVVQEPQLGTAHALLTTEPLDTITRRVTYSQQILKEFGWIDKGVGRGLDAVGSGYSQI